LLEQGQSVKGAGQVSVSPDGNYLALLMSVASIRSAGIHITSRNYLLDINTEKIHAVSPDSCNAEPVVWPAR